MVQLDPLLWVLQGYNKGVSQATFSPGDMTGEENTSKFTQVCWQNWFPCIGKNEGPCFLMAVT